MRFWPTCARRGSIISSRTTRTRSSTTTRRSGFSPLLGLLNVSEAQGDADGIEKSAENVLHLDPLNYRAQMADAYQQYTAKHYAMALATYRRVLTNYPDDMTALSGEA